MSRAKSCVKNHSQMAKRFFFGGEGIQWNVYARLHWPWLDWEGEGGLETGLLSLWRCIYSMIYLLSERERHYVFHCECEWPGADLSWATPSVSHPRKLTWPWVGCRDKTRASGTCYPVPHGMHTSHNGGREIHTYIHTRPKHDTKGTYTHTDVHSLKCFPSHAFFSSKLAHKLTRALLTHTHTSHSQKSSER